MDGVFTMKYKIVLVKWLDAVSSDPWTDSNEAAPTPALCYSVGFLHTKDKEKITLILNHDAQNDNVSCIMTIPLGMVKSVTVLKPSKPNKGRSKCSIKSRSRKKSPKHKKA